MIKYEENFELNIEVNLFIKLIKKFYVLMQIKLLKFNNLSILLLVDNL